MAFALLSSPSLVSVCDKTFIKPSSLTPPTLRYHKLSYIDQFYSNMYIPLAFFYPKVQQREESTDNELSQIAHLLQTSLSKTLVSYYPYAGKLRDNATIDCNDMGAEFLSVRINCTMSEILDHPDASQAESIVFPKDLPWANNYEGGNLLVAQVSKFDCGGIAISVCLAHKIGDGTSALNFVNDWSRMTHSPTTTTLSPKFVGDSVFSSNNYSPIITPQMLSDVSECVQKRIIFPTTKLDALRAKVAAESGVENPTRAEVVSALLFKCAIKAASSTTTSMRPSKFVHLLNVRSMLKSRLPQSTIGNILSSFSTTATKEEDIELPELVRSLRKGVEEAYKKDHVEQNEMMLEVVESMRKGKKPYDDEYENVYSCSNLCKFPLYKVDFGWGKPERVSLPNGPFKNFFFLKDYKIGEGVDARVMLDKQHMSEFERDEELLDLIS
ncbi:acylsugar acyltransferase 3-like [Solanum pennellii]|uniref:Acylsugar acyltransferase 3-like n=1 Tax=Solanum pennellii TaxID=28526 RepID=A0ABM1G3A1_SOLPN|nr:acylsugar acyltransferase 3-like [Solanum pennellii]